MAYNIKLLDWDTANFGFGVAELAYDGIFNFNLGDIRSYLAATYPEVKLLYIKTSKKIDRSNIFCDEKITYVKHHQGTNYEAYLNIESNKNKIITTDLYELAILSGKFSRYNLDVKFPKKSFRHLYMKWIENSVYTEFATDVLVYKYNSKIIGFLTYKDSNDISSIGQYELALKDKLTPKEAMKGVWKYSRDNARSPMTWNSGSKAGFTTGRPWLPLNDEYPNLNVETETEDENSVLNYYKNLIKLRKQYPALIEGDYEELLSYSPGIYAYARTTKDKSERIIVIANTTAKIRGYKIPELKGATLLASTYGNREATLLRSYEVRVYKVKK